VLDATATAAPPTRTRVLVALAASRRHALSTVAVLWLATLIVAIAALGIGPVPVDPAMIVRIIAAHVTGSALPADIPPMADQIVWTTRTPRIAMAVVAGAALAVAGIVLQSLTRNGLADPYLLGINGGASAGVALVVLVAGAATGLALSGAALAGAVLATVLVLAIAGGAAMRGPSRLVLSGLAVGYALTAITSFLLFWTDSPEAARSVLFWLLGSLTSVQPAVLTAAAIATIVGLLLLSLLSGRLDALASGDDSARAVGLDPEHARFAFMAGTSAMVGIVVSGVGGVGFIGLIVPHAARALVGARHRFALPAAAALGAALLVAADTVARTAFAPQEIPVGVITGALGAPVLLLLLRRSHS